MHRVFLIGILAVVFFLGSLLPAYCLLPAAYAPIAEADSSFGNGFGGPVSVTLPTNSSSQLLLVAIATEYDSGSPTINTPAGWTLVSSAGVSGVFPIRPQFMNLFSRTGNGATSETFTVTGTIRKFTWRAATYNNVNLLAPVNAANGSSSGDSTTHFAPSITTSIANTLLICFWAMSGSDDSLSLTQSGMTTRFSVPSAQDEGCALLVADEARPTTGPTGTRGASTDLARAGENISVALAPALPTGSKRRRPPIISE